MDTIPEKTEECIFLKQSGNVEIAKLTQTECKEYEESLKYYRDLKNSLDTAKEEVRIDIAKKGLKEGLSVELLMKLTGLTKEEIENLKK